MFKFIKNKFLFILLISIVTLVVLVIGAISLYKDTSSIFASDGYIIETSTKTNTKYYFSANTKYKENVEEKITFEDKDKNKVSVNPASFVHYDNGNISFLQKGALVNLSDITAPMVSYYNITSENTITYEQNHYTVTSNGKKINIDSFIGRINDSKYIVAGENISLKIPTESGRISGDYFEVYYLEEGIVKIDNKDHSYQVTAQDSYLYVGDNITISLGDGKIFYDGDAKMLMSQITINNNENINLDVEEDKGGGAGNGSGEGEDEDGAGTDGEGKGEGNGTDEGAEEGTGEGVEEGTGEGVEGEGEGTGEGAGGDGTGEGTSTTENVQIELIEANVTSTTIDLKMLLNNANLARGDIVAKLINIADVEDKIPEKRIELKNDIFELNYSSLKTDTTYVLTIVEKDNENGIQYFQKSFKTNELGLILEKVGATDTTLEYKIIFDENTEVTKARVSITPYDEGVSSENIKPKEHEFSPGDLEKKFTGLESDTRYKVEVDTVWIGTKEYDNTGTDDDTAPKLYEIYRIDTTLKEKPEIWGINVDADADEVTFTIGLENIVDNDKSIISYTYYIYLADDVENPNREVQCAPITKTDSDPLVLNLNEAGLKTGVDYRAVIVAQYNDNEMIREVATNPSNNFLINSKPKIEFKEEKRTINSVKGTITLIDANCTVPMPGRVCPPHPQKNNFTLRYKNLSTGEIIAKEIEFKPSTLTYDLSLEDLKSDTTYEVTVSGTYYDDDGDDHTTQIGEPFTFTTIKSKNIYFKPLGDNTSSGNTIVTFNAKFTQPEEKDPSQTEGDIDEEETEEAPVDIEEIATVTFNLYAGRETNKDKLIGTYTITDKKAIEDLFTGITIENSLFTDTTSDNLDEPSKLNTVEKLIKATNNLKGTLNGAYTVEVEDVYDEGRINKFTIINNVYIFNLTPAYYLDTRIATNPNNPYVTVTPILKENLTKEETQELAKEVENLDKLNDKTVVGVTIENSLSNLFVDSAYKKEDKTYEKAIVNYVICNSTLNDCDDIIGKLTDDVLDNDEEAKSKIELLSSDMGDQYLSKTQTIYLNTDEYQDFIRGYNYKIGFYITFTQEDGKIEHYTNEELYETLSIERQDPFYTQYISNSSSTSITYRYSFRDVDGALADNNFYYTLGGDKENYKKVEKSLIADEKYYDVTLPIDSNTAYTLYYLRKNTYNTTNYVEITTNKFETEYHYNNENAYTILNQNDNVLKIKLIDNDVTNRAYVYKVVIQSTTDTSLTYIRYFLASRLNTITEDTGTTDEEGNPITKNYKYIAIDYAKIHQFMGHNLTVTVDSYFDSGLVGYNQQFTDGFILKNRLTNKFLNIYNSGSNVTSTVSEEDINMGLYLLKKPFEKDGETIFIYNHLKSDYDEDKKTMEPYNPSLGATYYDPKDKELAEKIGVEFNTNPNPAGMILTVGKKDYRGYDAKVLKMATLTTDDNTYKFDAIVPTISVTKEKDKKEENKNTINSVAIEMIAKGIYGNNQFTKGGETHNKLYVELYSDSECTKPLLEKPKATNINIDEKDNNATIDPVKFENLNPQTTYYVKVFAYVKDKYTQLYDGDSTSASYITKTYETNTLNSNGIMSAIRYHVNPIEYNGESSKKQLNWKVTLKSTDNYKLRFELYKPNGTSTETNPETGEEVTITNFVPVKFDGTDANSCSLDKTGNSSNGYIYKDKDDIDNCYISVDKDDIDNLDNINGQKYTFTGDDFVFGGNYYKLVVYAIPYTNGSYIEDQKVLLYQNDSLTTTPTINTVNGISQDIDIPVLTEATFSLSNSLTAGFVSEDEGYFISFVPTIYDNHKVIKYGAYTVKLKDKQGNIVGSGDGEKCIYYINKTNKSKAKTTNECVITMDANSANQRIDFVGLTSNTPYYVELSYEAYRNNHGFTEDQKVATTPFTDLIYTPISNDITLGGITANPAGSTSVILAYNGSNNLTRIVKVEYTILGLAAGSSTTTGTYKIDSNNSNIFTISADRIPKLTINTNDNDHSSNTSFTFKTGNSYVINTTYYYLNEDGEEQLLKDPITGETTQTTFFNPS